MAEVGDFQVIFDKLAEARRTVDDNLSVDLAVVQQQNDSIVELMTVARELADPEPLYFTRG